MNEQEIKAKLAEIISAGNEGDTTGHVDQAWRLVVQVADFSYAQGKEAQRKLTRIQLGLQTPQDGV